MCNACGFLCCASDELGGCGCDHCENPDCWPDEDDDVFEEEFEDDVAIGEAEEPAPVQLKRS